MGHAGLERLRGAVRGAVLAPQDAGYDEERTGFQRSAGHRPDVIVAARTAQDVREAVGYARTCGLPVAVQATGHGQGAAMRGGVLVSTRHLTGIEIDSEAGTAWVEAGVRAGDLVAEAARYGLAPVNGSAPGVGVVSYTLGGGVGLLGRRFGYAADQVRRIEIVTGDAGAPLRDVTADSEPGLFAALRGGGGGWGVVTGMEIGLVPVERIFGGRLVFDGGEVAEELVRLWQKWTQTVPDELTSAVTLLPMPDLPGVPAPLRGRYLAQVHIAFAGTRADGEQWVEPLRALGSLLVDELREMPYTECASVFSEPDTPHGYRSANLLLPPGGLGDEALRSVLAAGGPDADVMCVLSMRHLGGALSRPPAAPDCVAHREAGYLLYALSPVTARGRDAGASAGTEDPDGGAEGAGGDAEVVRAHARVLAPAAGAMVGRSANFLYGPQSRDVARSAYPTQAADRLERLSEQYDPEGLFRFSLWSTARDSKKNPSDA